MVDLHVGRKEKTMETIQIKSRLYDYTVDFTDDFANELKKFEDTTAYVIDRNVYNLYEEKFMHLDQANIYFVDAIESKKYGYSNGYY